MTLSRDEIKKLSDDDLMERMLKADSAKAGG
jgi:hypothetical protein